MPAWGELLQELNSLRSEVQQQSEANPEAQLPAPVDLLRRKYLESLASQTGRSVIIYTTAWLEGRPGLGGDVLSIQLGDQQGFMEACSNLTDTRELDLILHSPGGSAEAADAIMAYLRTQFDHIRAIVPLAAMSAATMMALACDEIVMGDHSQLGPIDPQFTIATPEGPRFAPGQAIEDQFERAKEECANPANIAAWLPILRSYAPGLLAMCDHQQRLAEDFAETALAEHMFQGRPDAKDKAKSVAEWFADFKEFRSHGRRVGRDQAEEQGLVIYRLEEDAEFQDAVLSVHHAIQHTFTNTPSAKIVENHQGRAWIKMAGGGPLLLGGPGALSGDGQIVPVISPPT